MTRVYRPFRKGDRIISKDRAPDGSLRFGSVWGYAEDDSKSADPGLVIVRWDAGTEQYLHEDRIERYRGAP